jgi:hypothetical protein
MPANPLVTQGTLNRLRGSITIANFPNLNVTASYLGKAGISMSLDGESTLFLPTMTGAVTSPEPYMMATVTVNLLKTQSLASLYKAQMEATSLIGNFYVRADTAALPDYQMTNGAIQSVRELSFAGEDAGYVVALRAYYILNNNLWNLV